MPQASGSSAALIDRGVTQYGALFRQVGNEYGVPAAWLVAMAKRESGFNPNAKSADGGWGLFQITDSGLKAGRTFEQLADPVVNATTAAKYIAGLRLRYGDDFPTVTAAFNAGSPRPTTSNRWGLVTTGDHIDDEVATLNYALTSHGTLVAGVSGLTAWLLIFGLLGMTGGAVAYSLQRGL
jgi:soluble lytic murein transglycosylase-like protein